MNFDEEDEERLNKLYRLLPAIYRIRDEKHGGALRDLLSVIAEQIAVLEEDLEQLYDDQFIETCAPWVIPYIGDLIGYRALQVVSKISSPRTEVANTIAYRQRKGTAAIIEQIARDVTDWDACVVEFFQLLAKTQHMNHISSDNLQSVDLRKWKNVEYLNTPFDKLTHTVDVRHIDINRGKYNIPNIGIFLWRLKAYRLMDSPAFQVDDHRYMFSPLGNNMQLFTRPQAEDEITHLAESINVPMPISKRLLGKQKEDYYGNNKSLFLKGVTDTDKIVICDLSDKDNNNWSNTPPTDKIAIDPELGRIAFAEAQTEPPLVTFHYGFSADIGGGEYNRGHSFDVELERNGQIIKVPGDQPTIQDALKELGDNNGVIEITDNGRYEDIEELVKIELAIGQHIELRAVDGCRPTLVLTSYFEVSGGGDAELTINGLLITGYNLKLKSGLKRLRLCHCTLVPGLSLTIEGMPASPGAASLIQTESEKITSVEIDNSIAGPLHLLPEGCTLNVRDSIIDSPATTCWEGPYPAIIAPDDGGKYGPPTTLERTTIIGTVFVKELVMASNVIFTNKVEPYIRQSGCVRYSYLPEENSRILRCYRCQPTPDAVKVYPGFTSMRYGNSGYCQLSRDCAAEIRQGADDKAEMGVFHDLYQPQRETNLRVRLDEYLRFGLEAGIFYIN